MTQVRLMALVVLFGTFFAIALVFKSSVSSHKAQSQKLQPAKTKTRMGIRSRSSGKPHPGPVPVLMYHVITSAPSDAAYPELFVSAEHFTEQMSMLRENGFAAVTLDDVLSSWKANTPLPPKPIVLTFDDGYFSIFANAYPILKKLKWVGILNLKVDALHEKGSLSQRMVRKLISTGWELDSHSIHHTDLTSDDQKTLQAEAVESRRILQQTFHVPVNFFCYPSGRYNDRVIEAVRAAGYKGATTTDFGLAKRDSLFSLKRVRVDGSDTAQDLRRKINDAQA